MNLSTKAADRVIARPRRETLNYLRMFERYTEMARRVIFFARHEAGHYGSLVIDTEHLLLGLLRVDKHLAARLLGAAEQIRAEIDKGTPRGERVPPSVTIPLSERVKQILGFAAEEAGRLGHRRVGTEHLFLGVLRSEGSFTAQILATRGVKLEAVRRQLQAGARASGVEVEARADAVSQPAVERFLAALEHSSTAAISSFFAEDAQIVDCQGRLWQGLDEIDLEAFFAPYAGRNVRHTVATRSWGQAGSLVANIVWENVVISGESKRAKHRMIILFVPKPEFRSAIFFLQVTPVAV